MQTLEQKIAALPAVPAPKALKARILARIAEAAERSARLHRFFFGALSLVSAAALIPAFQFAMGDFSQSAFASYFSLLFTDGGAALANWKGLALSLMESAPFAGLTLVLAATFVFLASMRAFGRYADSQHLSHATS